MTRRGIIGALLGAATMDPERLLWVPGQRVISIPKPVVIDYSRYSYFEAFDAMNRVMVARVTCMPDPKLIYSIDAILIRGQESLIKDKLYKSMMDCELRGCPRT